MSFKDIALATIKYGVPVIRVKPKSKSAFDTGWTGLATTDTEVISKWDAETPEANCGAVAKAEIGGFWFLEIDDISVPRRIEEETGQKIPLTYRVRSRPGRGHYYWKQTPESIALGNVSQGFVKNEDFSVRVDREYVCASGSVHPISGEPYEVVCTADIIEAPIWLIEWIKKQKVQKENTPLLDATSPIGEGKRNDSLMRIAARMRNAGLTRDEIETSLSRINQERCTPPLPESEVKTIADSMSRYPVKEEPRVLLGGKPIDSIDNGTASAASVGTTIDPEDYKRMLAVCGSDELVEPEDIPPFDSSVMTGIYKDIVEVAIKGTTIPPAYVYGMAKTFIGALVAGKVKFETVAAEPRYYFTAIGLSGSSKGASWERLKATVLPESSIRNPYQIKTINSIDSSAGLRDLFFDAPSDAPVLCYVDEAAGLGNKSRATKNPDILDAVIELANSTTISRTLANNRGRKESQREIHNNARLAIVMCVQTGEILTQAFPGKMELGLQDRLYPELSSPVVAGKLPPVDPIEALKIVRKLQELLASYAPDANGMPVIELDFLADDYLENFWSQQSPDIQRKARFRTNLMLDAYMSAVGRGSRLVTLEDAETATKIFTRQMVIRKACFRGEIFDRVARYTARLTSIKDKMLVQLADGADPSFVAMSQRDFERATNSYRDNDGVTFERAWKAFARIYLRPVTVAKNGRSYTKYIPSIEG